MNSNKSTLQRRSRKTINEDLFNQLKCFYQQQVSIDEMMNFTGLGKSTVYKALAKIHGNPAASYSNFQLLSLIHI